MATILPSPPKVGMVSLGCPKNLVDSERILTKLRADGYAMSPDYAGADVVLVNTCGFLDSAKEESLEAIGEAIAENGRVIVTDCFGAEAETIRARFPQVLAVTGAHQYEQVVSAVHQAAPAPRSPCLDLVPGSAPALGRSAKPVATKAAPDRPAPADRPVAAPALAFSGRFAPPVAGQVVRAFGGPRRAAATTASTSPPGPASRSAPPPMAWSRGPGAIPPLAR